VHHNFGVHDTDALRFAMPLLRNTAHGIGELHFMTQIGKLLLRTRPEKNTEIAKLTEVQRGVHLKNEAKLFAYWTAVSGALDPSEHRCLTAAMACFHEKKPLTYEAVDGRVTSSASPVVVDSSMPRGKMPTRSLHHVELSVRIKGGMTVPCSSLQRADSVVHVRIDNVWKFESQLSSL
jgi:hypothetical protein